MSTKYKIRSQDKLHFVTYTVVQWVDAAMELGSVARNTAMYSWKMYGDQELLDMLVIEQKAGW